MPVRDSITTRDYFCRVASIQCGHERTNLAVAPASKSPAQPSPAQPSPAQRAKAQRAKAQPSPANWGLPSWSAWSAIFDIMSTTWYLVAMATTLDPIPHTIRLVARIAIFCSSSPRGKHRLHITCNASVGVNVTRSLSSFGAHASVYLKDLLCRQHDLWNYCWQVTTRKVYTALLQYSTHSALWCLPTGACSFPARISMHVLATCRSDQSCNHANCSNI